MGGLDEVFELLSIERRRFALYYLEQADGEVSVDELAEKIYEWETDQSVEGPPEAEHDEIVISLEHNHLPRLEDATAIEYVRDDDQLRITGTATEVEVILTVSKTLERPSDAGDIASVDLATLRGDHPD